MAWSAPISQGVGAANSMTVHAQLLLPDGVRARGMAIYQMALMGSTAIGAAVWGQIATLKGVHTSLAFAAAWAALGVAVAIFRMPHSAPLDHTLATTLPQLGSDP